MVQITPTAYSPAVINPSCHTVAAKEKVVQIISPVRITINLFIIVISNLPFFYFIIKGAFYQELMLLRLR
jgi:hypothetical protein